MSTDSILSVVEMSTDDSQTFISRFPLLNNYVAIGSKINVKENQIAIIVDGTNICDVFEAGTHTFSVETLPILFEKRNWTKHFNSKFTCDIYFVSLATFSNIKWAMVNPLILRDSEFGSVPIKCFGNFSFEIGNGPLFFENLFGKIKDFNSDDITLYLRTLVVTGITDILLEKRFSALDFIASYDTLEPQDYSSLNLKFAEHGLALTKLEIESVEVPEETAKLITMKVTNNIEKRENVIPINHPINSGVGYTEEMKRMFNFSNNLTVECIKCGATIARNFKYCPQCGALNKEVAKECPNCHNVVAFKANYCPDCGTQLFDKNNVILCKKCGSIVSEEEKFCPDCGSAL